MRIYQSLKLISTLIAATILLAACGNKNADSSTQPTSANAAVPLDPAEPLNPYVIDYPVLAQTLKPKDLLASITRDDSPYLFTKDFHGAIYWLYTTPLHVLQLDVDRVVLYTKNQLLQDARQKPLRNETKNWLKPELQNATADGAWLGYYMFNRVKDKGWKLVFRADTHYYNGQHGDFNGNSTHYKTSQFSNLVGLETSYANQGISQSTVNLFYQGPNGITSPIENWHLSYDNTNSIENCEEAEKILPTLDKQQRFILDHDFKPRNIECIYINGKLNIPKTGNKITITYTGYFTKKALPEIFHFEYTSEFFVNTDDDDGSSYIKNKPLNPINIIANINGNLYSGGNDKFDRTGSDVKYYFSDLQAATKK
jgi:hypothetical protein